MDGEKIKTCFHITEEIWKLKKKVGDNLLRPWDGHLWAQGVNFD